MIDKGIVEKAISPMRDAFAADGAGVEVGKIEGDSVTIRLLVGPETCRECMMPTPLLEQIFQQSLMDEGIENVQVQVEVVEEPSDAASQ